MAMNREDDVERVLAALRDAKTPEGMEARIADRLALHAAARGVEFQWRDVFAGSATAGVWWRGAVSGVAVAMLLVGLVWMTGHRRPSAGVKVMQERVAAEPPAAVVGVAQVKPCATPSRVAVAHGVSRVKRDDGVRVASAETSHPAPAMGLTAEERELVQLARTGNARDLAKAEAQDAAEFRRVFVEPAVVDVPPAPKVNNE
jgi:hypothetical protein